MNSPLLCVDVCLDPCLKETSEELLLGNILDMSDTFAGLLLQVDDWLSVEEFSYHSGKVRSKLAFGLSGLIILALAFLALFLALAFNILALVFSKLFGQVFGSCPQSRQCLH